MSSAPIKASLDSLAPPHYYQVRISDTAARETAQYFDSINNLEPIKYNRSDDSRKVADMATGQVLYSDSGRFNTFGIGERYTSFNNFASLDSEKTPTGPAPLLPSKTYVPPQMVESRSEGHIGHRSGVSSSSSSGRVTPLGYSSDDERSRISGETSVSSAPPSRGRATRRVASPAKDLEDIQEVQTPVAPPQSPFKRSRSPVKRLFGEGGLLGKSASMHDLPSPGARKQGLKNLGGKIKKGMGSFTETVTKSIPKNLGDSPIKSRSRSPLKSTFQVSLNPPAQAKLYSEVELMICATANQYLLKMHEEQRLAPDSLHKVLNSWYSKNRPQVMEFMFDQATQRDLIQQNIETFCFYGPHAASLVAMTSMLQAWKALAREMSVRTFCSPDSAVKKHLDDAFKVLEMLGAPVVTINAFREISRQAKNIIALEKKKAEVSRTVKFGIERKWEPPSRESEEYRQREMENPFA